MRSVKIVLLGLTMAFLICGCNAVQQRGMAGNAYVSTSRPAICVDVRDMPLKTAGRGTGTLYKPALTGALTLDVRTAVYASTPEKPMAVITHAELPSPRWIWSTVYPRVGGIHEGTEILDGQAFAAFTYLVPCRNDPFAGLAGEEPAEGQQTYWLARYFAARLNFNNDKLILEYREPAPAEFGQSLSTIPYGMTDALAAFEDRARKAFTLTSPDVEAGSVVVGYPTGVRFSQMSDPYLGDVLEHEPLNRFSE